MGKITYADKEALNEIPSIADINKCRAQDMNEIKNVVNTLLNDVSSSTAPANPVLNDLWIDTTLNILKKFDGTNWVAVGATVPAINNSYSTSTGQAYSCNYVNSIIESGSNANGNWIKYSDGTMICYRTTTGTVTINQAWGSLYYGDVTTEYDFAQAFIEPPNVQLRVYPTTSTSCWLGYGDNYPVVTNTSYKNFALLRPTSYSNVPFKIDLLAIGKWK